MLCSHSTCTYIIYIYICTSRKYDNQSNSIGTEKLGAIYTYKCNLKPSSDLF